MDASVLTIGTEITSGEIINSNAAWIAERLEAIGHTVVEHVTVRDERRSMLEAMTRLSQSPILIIAGGLGPTSDDITREVVAQWANLPLLFSEKAWLELSNLYVEKGLTLREAHRHQCFFPAQSEILQNPIGTAHGFVAKRGLCSAYVLPGPPKELEGMWMKSVASKLPAGNAMSWSHWTLLGMPESEVAEKVEPIVKNLGLEIGYRASVPYVFLKIRGIAFSQELERKLDAEFSRYLVGKGKVDLVTELAKLLSGQELLIQDEVTRGLLSDRLKKIPRDSGVQIQMEQSWGGRHNFILRGPFCAQIRKNADPCSFEVVLSLNGKTKTEVIKLPYKISVDSDRGARSVAEWALYKWVRWAQA
jgi:molybdenum cofactor synthesis domain-containing protein